MVLHKVFATHSQQKICSLYSFVLLGWLNGMRNNLNLSYFPRSKIDKTVIQNITQNHFFVYYGKLILNGTKRVWWRALRSNKYANLVILPPPPKKNIIIIICTCVYLFEYAIRHIKSIIHFFYNLFQFISNNCYHLKVFEE